MEVLMLAESEQHELITETLIQVDLAAPTAAVPPDGEAAAVARAEERTAEVWDPCENDDNYDDARMELYLAFAAEERRAALARSFEDDLGITPVTAVEARLLDIARALAGP